MTKVHGLGWDSESFRWKIGGVILIIIIVHSFQKRNSESFQVTRGVQRCQIMWTRWQGAAPWRLLSQWTPAKKRHRSRSNSDVTNSDKHLSTSGAACQLCLRLTSLANQVAVCALHNPDWREQELETYRTLWTGQCLLLFPPALGGHKLLQLSFQRF